MSIELDFHLMFKTRLIESVIQNLYPRTVFLTWSHRSIQSKEEDEPCADDSAAGKRCLIAAAILVIKLFTSITAGQSVVVTVSLITHPVKKQPNFAAIYERDNHNNDREAKEISW